MTNYQNKLAQVLIEKRVPEDWAYLIAKTSDLRVNDVDRWVQDLSQRRPSRILHGEFFWRTTKEGHQFWAGVYEALIEEEKWFEENGDLSVEQVKSIDKMVDAGMPQEWAIIVAQASDPGISVVFHSKSNPEVFVGSLLQWRGSKEGFDFWDSAYLAMWSESNHKRK